MHWFVRSKSKTSKVKIPFATNPNQACLVAHEGVQTKLLWHQPCATLQMIDANDVEHNIAIRSVDYRNDPDTGSYHIALSYRTTPQHNGQVIDAHWAELQRYAPGLEQRQAAQKKQGAVIRAPITGKLIGLDVKEGDIVTAGQTLLVIEAMKMENKIKAPIAGTVSKITTKIGDQAKTNQELLSIKPHES